MRRFSTAVACSALLAGLIVLSLACGGGSNAATAVTSGKATLSGTLEEGVLNKAQFTGNTYSVTATNSGTSLTGTLNTTKSSNTVLYSFNNLQALTQYQVTVARESEGSKVTIASTVATSGNTVSGSGKARAAAKSKGVEINMFTSFAARRYAKRIASGNSGADALTSALGELFPPSVSANVSDLSELKVKKGVVTMTNTAGNTVPLKAKAKANAKVKLISQVTKSAIYLPSANLASRASKLETLVESVSEQTSIGNISKFYKDPEFVGTMKDVKNTGTNIQSMMRELDPVLANMDFVKIFESTDLDALDLDDETALGGTFDSVFSSSNITKQLLSYELALEAYVDDFPEFDYNVDTNEFFEDFGDDIGEFQADGGTFDPKSWMSESVAELSDVFDDFIDDDAEFDFAFSGDDLKKIYSNTAKELQGLDTTAFGDFYDETNTFSFETSELTTLFEGLSGDFGDFGGDFSDISISLGDVYDEDELATFFADSSGIQVFDFGIAHPTYGYRKVSSANVFNFVVGTLAPVFRVEFLPNQDFEAVLDSELEELFDLEFTYAGNTFQGNVDSLPFSTLRHAEEPNVLYLAFHKSDDVAIGDFELAPGETFGFTFTPNSSANLSSNSSANVVFVDGSASYTGQLTVKPVTFTLPFESGSMYTQVDLFYHNDDFFFEDILTADVEEHMQEVTPSLFQASDSTGPERTSFRLSLNSGVISDDGTYEISVYNGDMLTWNGPTAAVNGMTDYIGSQFFDVDTAGFGESLTVVGTQSTVKTLGTTTPTILVHSAYSIPVNEGLSDLGLFEDGMLSLMAINHSENHDSGLTDSLDIDFSAFEGMWEDSQNSDIVLEISLDDFTWTVTGDPEGDETGTWDFFEGFLFIDDEEALYSFNEDQTILTTTTFEADGTEEVTTWNKKEEDGTFTAEDLVGTWYNQSNSTDVLTIEADGTWTSSDNSGVWELTNGVLLVDGEEETIEFSADKESFTSIADDGGTDVYAKTPSSTGGSTDGDVAAILSVLSPVTWELTFHDFSQGTSPETDGTLRTFLFSSSGTLYIDDVEVASNPTVTSPGYELTWDANGTIYSASLNGDQDNINEVNFFGPTTSEFYGQYRDDSGSGDSTSGNMVLTAEHLIGIWVNDVDETDLQFIESDNTYYLTVAGNLDEEGNWSVDTDGTLTVDGNVETIEFSDEEDSAPQFSNFTATGNIDETWNKVSSVVFTPFEGVLSSENLIDSWTSADGDGTDLEILSDGTWTSTDNVETETGTWSFDGTDLTVDGNIRFILFSDDLTMFGSEGDTFIRTSAQPSGDGSLTSDFTPPSGKVTVSGETPADKRLILARSTDGVTYTKDDQPFSDQANVPDILQDAGGNVFLYYTGWTVGDQENTSAVAVSQDDGNTWAYKYLNIDGTDFATPGDPDVVMMDDGTFRMFFTGTINNTVAEIHYADSTDGINFTYGGNAYTNPTGGLAKDSITFRMPDGSWGMYVYLDDYVFATSQDGATFTKDSDFSLTHNSMTYILDNELTNDDGSYTFYAFSFGSGTTPAHIAAFDSTDGVNLTFSSNRLEFDDTNALESQYVKNGTPYKLASGNYLLAYTTVIE